MADDEFMMLRGVPDDAAALMLPADHPRHVLAECRDFDERKRIELSILLDELLVLARKQATRSGETAALWAAGDFDRRTHLLDLAIVRLVKHAADINAGWSGDE